MTDPSQLQRAVQDNIETLCREYFPGGKREGTEWRVSDVSGNKGRSLGISLLRDKAGLWYDQETGQGGCFSQLLEQSRSLGEEEARNEIRRRLGLPLPNGNGAHASGNGHPPFDWASLEPLSPGDQGRLAKWRGYSPEFVQWLASQDLIRVLQLNGIRHWAFPVMKAGRIQGCHHRPINWEGDDRPRWNFRPTNDKGGPGAQPFVIGDLTTARKIHVFESTWDMLAACDQLALHTSEGVAAFCTRGSGNGGMVQGIPQGAEIYVWMQNDEAAVAWLAKTRKSLAAPYRVVCVPEQHKDLNDWLRDGATTDLLNESIKSARLYDPLPGTASPSPLPNGGFTEAIQNLIEAKGSPASLSPRGRVTKLNEPFWAGLYAEEHELLFEPTYGKFFVYDGDSATWIEESENHIRKALESRILVAAKEWEGHRGLGEHRNAGSLAGVITHLRGEVEKPKAFDQEPNLIHLANCTLRVTLDGWVNLAVGSENYALFRSPIAYDPGADCPQLKQKLLSPLSVDDQQMLQKLAALTLTGENPLQRFLVLDGIGGSGKSTYIQLLAELLGPYKTSPLRTKYLGDRFEIGQLRGKSLLTGPDVDANFFEVEGASVVKALCGGDRLKGEIKGGNITFDVEGRFNIAISANTRLKIKIQGDESAWVRRAVIVRYEKAYPRKERILDFHKVLVRQEGAGILNWALAGLEPLRRDIQATGDIVLSQEQVARVDSLIQESQSLRHFLQARVQTRHGADLSVDELVSAYTVFCQQHDWAVDPIRKVQARLETLLMEMFSVSKSGSVKRVGKNVRGYCGVTFRTAEDEDPCE